MMYLISWLIYVESHKRCMLNPTNATIPHVGSSAQPYSTSYHSIPQHHPVSPPGTTIYAGSQQPQPYMACPQPRPRLQQQPVMPWPRQDLEPTQQNQEQLIMPSVPQPNDN